MSSGLDQRTRQMLTHHGTIQMMVEYGDAVAALVELNREKKRVESSPVHVLKPGDPPMLKNITVILYNTVIQQIIWSLSQGC